MCKPTDTHSLLKERGFLQLHTEENTVRSRLRMFTKDAVVFSHCQIRPHWSVSDTQKHKLSTSAISWKKMHCSVTYSLINKSKCNDSSSRSLFGASEALRSQAEACFHQSTYSCTWRVQRPRCYIHASALC